MRPFLFFVCGLIGTSLWAASENRIIPAQSAFIASAPHGHLERIGRGDDSISLLYVWGSPEEMGQAHGQLLKGAIQKHSDRLISLMTQTMQAKPEKLDQVYEATRRHIPAHFTEEMKGLAAGARSASADGHTLPDDR